MKRKPVISNLVLDEKFKKLKLDLSDLIEKIKDQKNKILVICNPHNPSGTVWNKNQLKIIGDMCVKYKKTIICDEIFAPMVHKNYQHTSIGSISSQIEKITISLFSPTKSFNLSGFNFGYVVIADPI